MKRHFQTALAIVALTLSTCAIPVTCCAQEEQPLPFANRMLAALFNKDIQKNLELVDEQANELQTVLDEVQEKRKTLAAELREYQQSGVTESELEARREEVVEDFEKQKAEFQSKATSVLLPHQRDRLRQLTVQFMMRDAARRNNVPTGMLSPEIREYLDIDDKQAEKIKDRATELREELMEKIQKLTKQAQDELLSELSDPQKKKYKKLVGEIVQGELR